MNGSGYTGFRGDTVDKETTTSRADALERLDRAPKVADALKRGVAVSVAIWGGREVLGVVCDRDEAGLLLDVDEDDGAEGYAFLPWTSIEQVGIRAVTQRRVKFLPG